MSFHCRVCGQNIGRIGDEPVIGDGVCDACELKQPGLCQECVRDGRAVKAKDCAFHNRGE